MIFLLLSICSGTAIMVLFRLIDSWSVNKLEAITLNYATAFLVGFFINLFHIHRFAIPSVGWIWTALIIGILFVVMFYVLGIAVANAGIGISTIAAKMSVVIPILFSIYAFGEHLNSLKTAGIILALISLGMVLYSRKTVPDHKRIIFPLILFIGMGIVDSSVKTAQQLYVSPDDLMFFSSLLFLVSFLASLTGRMVTKQKRMVLHKKLLLTGILLGLANLGSLYFFISALDSGFRESALIFGINNIGIVTLSVVTGIVFYRERLSKINSVGMVLALISLYLLFKK